MSDAPTAAVAAELGRLYMEGCVRRRGHGRWVLVAEPEGEGVAA